jgi:MFS family permease
MSMPADRLVLLKSRRQRAAEMVIAPMMYLPIGPVMRALLGERYALFYGLIAAMLLSILVAPLGSRLAPRFGGKWVTKSERLRSTIAETASTSPWPMAFLTMATTALYMFGLLLILTPLGEMGAVFHVSPSTLGVLLVVLSVLTGTLSLLRKRTAERAVVVEEDPPADYFRSDLRRIFRGMALAFGGGAAAGMVAGFQFDGFARFVAFLVTGLIVMQILCRLIFQRWTPPLRVYPSGSDHRFGRHMLFAMACFGVPITLTFTGFFALEMAYSPVLIAIMVPVMILICGATSFGVGALSYFVRRLEDRERLRAD